MITLSLFEAAVKIEDKGFSYPDFENSKFQVLETKYCLDYDIDKTKNVNYDNKRKKFIPNAILSPIGGNELSILRVHDPIRNSNRFSFSFINTFEKDFIENHTFELDSVTVFNGEYVYCIDISYFNKELTERSTPQKGHFADHKIKTEALKVEGKIYISGKDYAIHKIIYTNFFESSKNDTYLFKIIVEYKKFQDKMYLNYLSFSNYFEIKDFADPDYFKLDEAIYDQSSRDIALVFNHNVDAKSALKKASYTINYQNENVKIESISLKEPNKVILHINKLYGDLDSKENPFTIKLNRLRNAKGKRANKAKTISMYQYRELFVNNVENENFSYIPYFYTIPKTRPLYLLKNKNNPSFWKTYNFVRNKPLLK